MGFAWLRDRRFWLGVGITVAVGLTVPLVVIGSGIPNMSALPDPDPLERTVGPWMLHRSRAMRAPREQNPLGDSPAAIASGLDHYRENCLPCHGAPNGAAAEFAQGFHPPAPHLTVPRIQRLSDGELFWTVKNGVKMTGMPGFGGSHDDQEIWQIVAAVRRLSRLTDEEAARLTATNSGHHHHHEAASETGGSEAGGGQADDRHHDEAPSSQPSP